MRGQSYGRRAAAEEMAGASCCDGRLTVLPGIVPGQMWLRVMGESSPEAVALTAEEAEFFAGILLAYSRPRVPDGAVKVPDIQPNSIYGEKT